MPEVTIASAISRMSLSLTLQPNLFQLFQPMGGVAPTEGCWATAETGKQAKARKRKTMMRCAWTEAALNRSASDFEANILPPPVSGTAHYKGVGGRRQKGGTQNAFIGL